MRSYKRARQISTYNTQQIYEQVKAVRPSGSLYDPGLGLAPQEW